jgi:hypothetical protein
MKTLTSILISFLLGAISAHANIGDTYEYSCKRYGTPAGTQINKYSNITEVVWYIVKNNIHWTYVASFNGPISIGLTLPPLKVPTIDVIPFDMPNGIPH